jgi:hypothetical protein
MRHAFLVAMFAAVDLTQPPPAHAGAEQVVKAGVANRPLLIREHAAWNGDCKAVPYPAVHLDRPPRHGAVCARVTAVTIRTMYTGTESQCIGRVVQGLRLIYFPRPGFAGRDRLRYSVQYPSVRRSVAVRVTVGAEAMALPAGAAGAAPGTGQAPGPVPPCAMPVS